MLGASNGRARHVQDTPPPQQLPPSPAVDGWQALPARGRWLAVASAALVMGGCVLLGGIALLAIARAYAWWWCAPAAATLTAAGAGWIAGKRYRLTRWRLDDHGLALVRGRWWRTETRVPITRVQHLDLRRGPLENLAGLATLVVHTAGTRLNAVAIAGLDQRDAEQLRDRLARQLDHDDDAL
jgi:uncharacterized protein